MNGWPELLPIQIDLLDRGREVFRQGAKRVIFQAHCGAGKTIIAAEQTRRCVEANWTVLHIVHRRRLVDQMIDTLAKFDVQASPIMQGRHAWECKVYCASRDTLLSMIEQGAAMPLPKIIIPDECHILSTKVTDWYLKNSPDSLWCGYTATPIYSNGNSMNPPWQKLVCMKPTSELLKIGRLVPVKVYNPDAVGRRRRKGEKVKPVGNPIDHWRKYADGQSTVVFAATVAESQAVCQRYRDAGVSAEHLDASTSDTEREDIFERSRTGRTLVICNCGVLIEGIDLPWLRACQILRGCNSLILWIQATGRVLRSFPGKSHGIILDHAGAAHEYGLPDSDFQWTLDDEATNARRNKPPKDRKPTTCPACGFMFLNKPACPECGKVMPKKKRRSLLDQPGDGILTRYSGEQAEQIRQESLNRFWQKCIGIGKAKGWQMRQCAGMFSREAKVPPWEANLAFHLPHGKEGWSMPVVDWVRQS